jgi:hypothetical protein
LNINEIYGGNGLKPEDLKGREATVTISDCVQVEFTENGKKEKKLELFFHKASKSLICNKTNALTIAGMYGEETDNWIGKKITLIPSQTDFKGEQVKCIRVKLTAPQQTQQAPPPPPVDYSDAGEPDIPF